jgi:hypothetical protein
MASVTICILNSVCTVSYTPVCVSLLLQKQTTYRKLQSHIMVRNYILISLLAGNELITEFTTKHILHTHKHTHTHKETNNSLCKSHTSANFTSNIFPDQASITSCVQLCHNVLCWVTLMKVRTEIQNLTVLKSCDIYCTVHINSTIPKSN